MRAAELNVARGMGLACDFSSPRPQRTRPCGCSFTPLLSSRNVRRHCSVRSGRSEPSLFRLELRAGPRSNGGSISSDIADCFCLEAPPHDRLQETRQAHSRQLPRPRRRAVGDARRRRLLAADAGSHARDGRAQEPRDAAVREDARRVAGEPAQRLRAHQGGRRRPGGHGRAGQRPSGPGALHAQERHARPASRCRAARCSAVPAPRSTSSPNAAPRKASRWWAWTSTRAPRASTCSTCWAPSSRR